jgi:hypothetical protein
MVRSYFAVIEKIGKMVPSLALWADAEMTACSRYVAALMDQHFERNIACAAELRGIILNEFRPAGCRYGEPDLRVSQSSVRFQVAGLQAA